MSIASFEFDPIVPYLFIGQKKEEMLQNLRKLKEAAGIRRFMLVFPSWNGDSKGPQALHAFEQFGDLLKEVRERVAADGIEVGWWCSPSLAAGPEYGKDEDEPFQKIVGIDGAVSRSANCPLDRHYIKLLGGYLQTVVERGAPPYIFFEDDYEVSNHDVVQYGCFCPLHLERFSERIGKTMSRAEVEATFRRGDEQSAQLRKAWAILMKDSLVELAGALRRAVDEVAPQTRMALCQPGTCDFDGDLTEAVARAFAGSTKPMVRLFGTDYNSDVANNFPALTFHFLHAKQTLGEDLELIHESDPFPHSRFFFSAAKLRSLITLAMFYGLDGALTYVTQYTDGPLEEEGYYSMVGASRAFFSELRRSVTDCRLAGPRLMYRPHAHVHRPIVGAGVPLVIAPAWASVLGRFGIPYAIKSEEGAVMVCGEDVLDLTGEEIVELLSGGVFLDGLAAFYLCQKGYGDLLGTGITEMDSASSYRICQEKLTASNPWRAHTQGSRMYFTDLTVTTFQRSNVFRLDAHDNSVQTVSEFIDEFGQTVAPATLLYTNRLGGRVAINAFNLALNASASIYNYKRKEQFRGIIEWLSGNHLPVYAEKAPNVFVGAQEHKESGDKIVAVFNLSLDALKQVSLLVDDSWKKEYVYRLHEEGYWEIQDSVQWERLEGKFRLTVPGAYTTLQPLILKFSNLNNT